MRLKWFILGILLAVSAFALAQPLIGLTKEEVLVVVKRNNREFRRDNSVVRQQFNYLKYVNGLRTKTWIIYFSDEDICTGTKLVCDYSEYDKILKDLNETLIKVGRHQWEYNYEGGTIDVELVKEEWYFTLREKRKKSREISQNKEKKWKQRIS